ncbi:ABC transporter ATP-binding protein [Methyloradius palustris]|uniref:Nitrate ABC transporter ATP-binding protein n=1 Tax=Methyloradius palustris TaxID=2778876 RepID=A0A8D5G1U8_9PROT|nr:ABC transporter ATP-binding protein [Methyloradius palustris]BCM24135.1 nitrate ABC transporter ATP-binding protein [Methyloradius palustris]
MENKTQDTPVTTKPVAERYVQLENVNMTFVTKKGTFEALRNVDFSIQEGEFISIIGHSGCGKSTVLNLIAGLLNPTDGNIFCAGREVAGPGPERAVVFQNHSLLPWLSCFENVYLAVERVFGATEKKEALTARTKAVLELVGLTHAIDKRPNEISGGMKQRVGIARALAMEPKVLLLDEPFGALDALTRAHLQDELMGIMAKSGCTAVMVTHDVDEAVLLSDRIVMMTNGPAATVGEILSVDLARPRKRLELAEDRDYNHLRSEVLKFLYERHAKKAA